jgi:hypothetical protein
LTCRILKHSLRATLVREPSNRCKLLE